MYRAVLNAKIGRFSLVTVLFVVGVLVLPMSLSGSEEPCQVCDQSGTHGQCTPTDQPISFTLSHCTGIQRCITFSVPGFGPLTLCFPDCFGDPCLLV